MSTDSRVQEQPVTEDAAVLPPFGEEPRAGLSELWGILRPVRGVLALGALLALLGAVASLLQPLLMVRLINAAAAGTSLVAPLAVLAVVFLLDAVLTGLQSFVLLRGGESLAFSVRRRLIRRVMFWRLRSLESFRSGDILARVGNDVSSLRAIVSEGTVDLFGALLSFIGAIALMIYIDSVLFFVSIGVMGLSAVLVIGFLTRIRTATEEAQQEIGAMSADLDRALAGMPTVITADMRAFECDRITGHAAAACDAGRRAAAWDALVGPVLITGANAAFLVIFGVGGVRVANGSTDLAAFISFVLYFAVLVTPLLVSFQAITTIQRGLGSLKRVQEILAEPGEDDVADGEPSPRLRAEARGENRPVLTEPVSLEFRHVRFAHADDRAPLFYDLDLRIAPRTIAAVTGPSGQGKTTLLSLALGLYDVDGGVVLLNGVPLPEIDEEELRRAVAYVQQDAPLFWGSLRDNLTYGVRDPREDDVVDVVDRLGLAYLVHGLPEGLDTDVGDRGSRLSGGESQRVALARAVLRRPRLLVLDEPTSQIDRAAETLMMAELVRMRESCTVLLTSHRGTTVEAADVVIDLATCTEAVRAEDSTGPGAGR